MKILFLAHKLPYPLHDGYNLHNYNYVRRLSGQHEFHLVALGDGALPMEVAGLFRSVRILAPRPPAPQSSTWRRLQRALRVDEVFDFDPEVFAAIQDVLQREDIDVVWTAGAKMLVYSHRLKGLPVLGDIADEAAKEALTDLRRSRTPVQIARSAKNLANTWRFQRKYLAHARICTVVSEGDQQMLAKNCPRLDVRMIPNGVDGDIYRPLHLDEEFPSLVFEGAMNFAPNVEGVVSFCQSTLPLIRERRPEAKLVIVGKDPVPQVVALAGPHVQVTGFVDDVRPYVDRASLFVCPLLRGAGIKNKILQAWAMQKAVVATSVSCGGLPLECGGNIEVADTPRAFADVVLALLDDAERRRALGRAGRQTVLEHCSWDTRARQMEGLLQELAGVPARVPG